MSGSQQVYIQLEGMGIDPVLAREASVRYHTTEAAANWCFGDGADWKPAPQRSPVLPARPREEAYFPSPYAAFSPRRSQGTSVQHREVVEVYDDSPAPSPKPRPSQIQLGSNNPFLLPTQPASTPELSPSPDHLAPPDYEQEQTTDRLENGLGLEVMDLDADRGVRERSTRASGAPPPSPRSERTLDRYFGPTNKTDKEGNMSLVPSTQDNVASKEDTDLDKAIQESLMTASFHSASAMRDKQEVQPTRREDGAPLALYSASGNYTYAANVLQAFVAIPGLCDVIHDALLPSLSDSNTNVRILGELCDRVVSDPFSCLEVDEEVKAILQDFPDQNQLPPLDPAIHFHGKVVKIFEKIMESKADEISMSEAEAARRKIGAHEAFETKLSEPQSALQPIFVNFTHTASSPATAEKPHENGANNVYGQLAKIMWDAEQPLSIVRPSDVMFVAVHTVSGSGKSGGGGGRNGKDGEREAWKLDEEVVLDRFLQKNAAWAANRRGLQALSTGNARRTQEKIDLLTKFEGNNYLESIKTVVKHLETLIKPNNLERAQKLEDMRFKLGIAQSTIQTKTEALEKELEGYKNDVDGAVFETDDPAMREYVYSLQAILIHDGALVGPNHLYTYVTSASKEWWKIEGHMAERVEWETIEKDKSGLWMDGGVYMMMYSRQSEMGLSELLLDLPALEADGQEHLKEAYMQSEQTSELQQDPPPLIPLSPPQDERSKVQPQPDATILLPPQGPQPPEYDIANLMDITPSTDEEQWIEHAPVGPLVPVTAISMVSASGGGVGELSEGKVKGKGKEPML